MPDTLQALLGQAQSAGPLDRIEFRDRIASFGDEAVAEVAPWLRDDALAGFAVRVLERIGREPECRTTVVNTLLGARAVAPDSVRGDIDTVLIGFGRRVSRRAPGTTTKRTRAS